MKLPVLDAIAATRAHVIEPAALPDALSVRTATRALERVLFDEPVRAQLLAGAPAALAKFTWPRAARETLRVLEQC